MQRGKRATFGLFFCHSAQLLRSPSFYLPDFRRATLEVCLQQMRLEQRPNLVPVRALIHALTLADQLRPPWLLRRCVPFAADRMSLHGHCELGKKLALGAFEDFCAGPATL